MSEGVRQDVKADVIEARGLHKTFAEGAGASRVEVHVLQVDALQHLSLIHI